jgi:hypothetical protein
MSLRFKADEPVIWTRFSALNPGGMTMNLYLVTDSPMFIGEIPTTFQNGFPNTRWNGRKSADYPVTRVFTGELDRSKLAKYPNIARILDEDVWSDAKDDERHEMMKLNETDPERFARQTAPRYRGLWMTRFMGHAPQESLSKELNFVPEKASSKQAAARLATVLRRNASLAEGKRKAIECLRASEAHIDFAALTSELSGPDADIRRAFAEALGALARKSTAPALIDAMEREEDFFARAALRDALAVISGERHKLTEAGKYRQWWEKNR